jgi:hypothetical protein
MPCENAQTFFQRGHEVASKGDFDSAIEFFLQGFALDPDNLDAHKEFRDIALRRKAAGGKPMGMLAAWRLRRNRDAKQRMLNSLRLLAYDPGHSDDMLTFVQAAYASGCESTAEWMHRILKKAMADHRRWPW